MIVYQRLEEEDKKKIAELYGKKKQKVFFFRQ